MFSRLKYMQVSKSQQNQISPAESSTTTGIQVLAKESLMRSTLLQMASVIPFPTSQGWYHFMRVQISGHSSVQSSSTFGSRKARKPIYILRFKKIEQGKLLYPKIFPLIFLKTLQEKSSICSRLPKSGPDKISPKTVYLKLGFTFSSRWVTHKGLICSPWS